MKWEQLKQRVLSFQGNVAMNLATVDLKDYLNSKIKSKIKPVVSTVSWILHTFEPLLRFFAYFLILYTLIISFITGGSAKTFWTFVFGCFILFACFVLQEDNENRTKQPKGGWARIE